MTSPRRRPAGRRLLAGLAPAALAIVLTGCSGGTTPGPAGTPGTTPGSPAGGGSSSTPAPSTPTAGTTPSTGSTATASGTGSGTGCTSAHLSASLVPGGAAAGSTMPVLVLTNTGADTCTLEGWPGVSFVGGGDGTQLGAAADRDETGPHGLVTLAPGAAAHVPMRIANAQNYDAAACKPAPADGLRVYPPGQKDALFVAAAGLTACRSDVQHLISVQAVQPGAS